MHATAFSLLTALAVAPSLVQACGSPGPTAVAGLHREWILVGWEKRMPFEPWDFREKVGRFYDWESKDVVLYDSFDPQHRLARSPDEYSDIFSAPFKSLKTAHHRVVDEPRVIVGGQLATSTLEFAARLEDADGGIVAVRARSTLVWRCTGDGWKIVREHNSVRPIGPAETADLFK